MTPCRALIRWLSGERGLRVPRPRTDGFRDELGSSRDQSHTTTGVVSNPRAQDSERAFGRLQMRLAQARADYAAAKQIWPKDRKAVDRAWREFRDARCAQISAEIGR